jgi:hypothetical protein
MRSDNVTKGPERAPNRSLFYAMGYTKEDLEKPLIAVVSAHSDIVPGHMNLDKLTDAVKMGIEAAGGTPFMVPAIGVCDGIAMGHIGMKYSLASRELIADSTETMVMAHQFDGAVLIPNCDKIVPGMVMAAMFVMPVIGRMAMVLVIFAFPYARPEGMGKVFAEMADRKTLLLSLLTTLIFVLPWGKMACLALAGGLVWGWLVAYYAYRKLGGLTGDVYGATELLTETAVLCLFLFSPLIPGGSELFWK